MTGALVSTGWVAEHMHEPGVRVIEVSSTRLQDYARGHLPGALAFDWPRDLIEQEDESSGLVIDAGRFAALARRLALHPDDTLIFYGDDGGRHACRALWTFQYYRHPGPLHLMDGGRDKWQQEDRPMTPDAPAPPAPSGYPVPPYVDGSLRATRDEIESKLGAPGFAVLDARTREEYEAKDLRSARGGHIPGALHVFWRDNLAPDGTFKSKEELAALYDGLPPQGVVAAHCQLGMRSAHTWFVLRHILGFPHARNYDGSWQEWGNLSGTPIEQ